MAKRGKTWPNLWPTILSPHTLNFWPGGPVPPSPRPWVAMAGPPWPWPWVWPRFTTHGHGHIYVGVSNFFGETSCLYLHAIRYRSGGTSPPTLNFWPGGTSPPTPMCGHGRVAMAWVWPRFTAHGHGHTWAWATILEGLLEGPVAYMYLHAMRYPPQRYISGLGGPVPPHAHAMAGPPWPWPWVWPRFTARRHNHGHGHGHVLPRPLESLVSNG